MAPHHQVRGHLSAVYANQFILIRRNSLAEQLVAQSGELVGIGEGAVGGVVGGGVGHLFDLLFLRSLAVFGCGSLGVLEFLGNEFLVLLPQIVSGGVLGLPLLTLLLVTSDPLVGVRVEAFGVLVVALLVVLGRHAVDGRIEVLGSRINGVVGLLEGQGDAATVEIDVNHLDEDFLARLDDGLRVLHVAVGQLGDMHEAFDAVFDGDEDTELNDLGDLALDDLARNVGAGGAVLLEPTTEEFGVLDTILRTDGVGYPHLIMKSGGSAYPPSHETVDNREHFVYQDGRVVFKYAVSYMADVAAEIAEKNGLTHDDIAWIVPHQANLRIIDATAKRLGVDMDKVMINIQKYGNTSAGTIPICLWEWENQLKKGDNLILAAFGAGFTWGAVYLKWGYDGKKA